MAIFIRDFDVRDGMGGERLSGFLIRTRANVSEFTFDVRVLKQQNFRSAAVLP